MACVTGVTVERGLKFELTCLKCLDFLLVMS